MVDFLAKLPKGVFWGTADTLNPPPVRRKFNNIKVEKMSHPYYYLYSGNSLPEWCCGSPDSRRGGEFGRAEQRTPVGIGDE